MAVQGHPGIRLPGLPVVISGRKLLDGHLGILEAGSGTILAIVIPAG